MCLKKLLTQSVFHNGTMPRPDTGLESLLEKLGDTAQRNQLYQDHLAYTGTGKLTRYGPVCTECWSRIVIRGKTLHEIIEIKNNIAACPKCGCRNLEY